MDTASALLGHERVGLHELLSILGHSVLVARIVLLFISGDVFLAGGPGVDGGSPSAVSFNGNVVSASDNTDETILTEVFTPGVSNGPVLLAVLNTVADNGDIVDDVLVTGLILEDTRGIVLESIGDSDTASNGATLVDLLHHSFLTRDLAVLINVIGVVRVRDEASLAGHAVLALEHGGALGAIIVTTSSVDGASFIGNVVVVHPFEGVVGLTTMAAIIS